jgi:hypothetical protein
VPEYVTSHRARPGLAPSPLGKSRIGSSLRAFAAHFLPTDRLPPVFEKWSALSPTLFSYGTHSHSHSPPAKPYSSVTQRSKVMVGFLGADCLTMMIGHGMLVCVVCDLGYPLSALCSTTPLTTSKLLRGRSERIER